MRKFFEKIGFIDSSISTAQYIAESFKWLLILGGGGMSGISALSSPLAESLGTVFPIGVAVLVTLALASIFWLYQSANSKAIQDGIEQMLSAEVRSINPLQNSFENIVIPISELRLPGQQQHKRKIFRDCHFVGPGLLLINGGTMDPIYMHGPGSIIPFSTPIEIVGVTVFDECIIERCHFHRVQLAVGSGKNIDELRDKGFHIAGDQFDKSKKGEKK